MNKSTKYSFCRICEAACGLIVETEEDRITDIRPNPNHVATRGYACKKGLKFHELEHSPDRLLYPMKRMGDSWKRIDWDQALSEIGGKIRLLRERYGPDSIGMYGGNGLGFGLLHPVFAQGFMAAVGSKNVFASASQDCSNKFAVARLMYGFPMTQGVPDFEHGGCMIVIGANPVVTKFSFKGVAYPVDALKRAESGGCRIFHVNPRRTESAKVAGRWVPIRPGTDVYLLAAFAREVIGRGAARRELIDRHMRGFETFRQIVEPWTIDRAARVTGIDAETVTEMMDAYLDADGASLYCSLGVNQARNGTVAFWILEVINAITGNLDRRGGTLVGTGLIDFARFAVKNGIMTGSSISRIGNLPSVVDGFPGSILADEILTPGPGQIRALFCAAGNPAMSLPDTSKVQRAFRELELLVCIDIFRTVTGNFAHYLLPGVTFLQRPDINFLFQSLMGIADRPSLTYSDAMRPPEGEQMEEHRIYLELARVAGLPFFGSRLASALFGVTGALGRIPGIGHSLDLTRSKTILSLLLRLLKAPGIRTLRRNHDGIRLPDYMPESFIGKRVYTEDGKIDLAPEPLVRAAERLEEDYHAEIGSGTMSTDTGQTGGTLRLITMREPLTHNSYFRNGPSFVPPGRNTSPLHIHPQDAEGLGLSTGGWAEVSTERGSITVPVNATPDMAPGSVGIPWGWGHQEADGLSVARKTGGANVNHLTPSGPDAADPVSGMARLTGIDVTVLPAEPPHPQTHEDADE